MAKTFFKKCSPELKARLLVKGHQVALWLVLDYKVCSLPACQLGIAGLFCIEMVEAGLASNNLAILGKLESFTKRFICLHSFHILILFVISFLLLWLNLWDLFCNRRKPCNLQ